MQTYIVGGAVRDALLGQPMADRDWVVVGSTPEQLLAAGYTPVGRDLTMNAIAAPPGWDGSSEAALIDPFGGVRDVRAGVLRHVSAAFVEDPVRVLRLARFAARYPTFRVADETMQLCCQMVRAGELDHLVPERVWQELAGALMQPAPQRAFEVLRACGALAVLLPELDALWVRWAVLVHDLGKATTPPDLLPRHHGHEARSAALVPAINARLRVPGESAQLAEVTARVHGRIHRSGELDAAATLRLLLACDALRRPARFAEVLLACECDKRGRQGHEDDSYPPRERLLAALECVQRVDTASIVAATRTRCAVEGRLKTVGESVAAAIYQARVAALRAWLRESGEKKGIA